MVEKKTNTISEADEDIPVEDSTESATGEADSVEVQTVEEDKAAEELSEVEKLRAEAETARDRMLRAAAEFENYKKRAEREKNEFMKYVAEGFISDLLPVLDNLERAIGSVAEDDSSNESIREGISMTYHQLLGVLEKRNVHQIQAVGEIFDPEYHEAMAKIPSDEPENTVVEAFQHGYVLHDRVIRPARVIVSQGPQKESETDNSDG